MNDRWSYILRVSALALLYAVLAKHVLEFLSPNGVISIVWPLSGLALAALLLGGKKYWPGIFIGALFGNMLAGSSFPVSLFIAPGNTLEALTAAWLLSRKGGPVFRLASLFSYFRLLWVAALSASISALTGCTTLWVSGSLTLQSAGTSLLHWWQGDVLGLIVVTPLILVWQQAPHNWLRKQRVVETIVCFGLAFLAGQIVFLGWFGEFFGIYARGFWMFVFIVWGAVRFGRHGASLLVFMFALQAILSPLLKVGFFAQDIARTGLTNYWVYTLLLGIVGMALATLNYERLQGERATRAREARFKAIIDNAMDAVVLMDSTGRISEWSKQAEQVFGWTRADAIGRAMHETIIPARYRDACHQGLQHLPAPGKSKILNNRIETHALHRDGHEFPIELTVSQIMIDGKQEFNAFIRDITLSRQAQEDLRRSHDDLAQAYRKLRDAQAYLLQAEKMTSIGQLASGVAHEINNPIGFIYSNLVSLENYLQDVFGALEVYRQAAKDCITDPQKIAALQRTRQELDLDFLKQDIPVLMNESREGIMRVKNIVQSLREFAQIDNTIDWNWENLHHCLDNTLNVLQGALPGGIKIIREYGELPEIECLPAQLNQMFMNLLLNAAQAIGEQGSIKLRSGCDTDMVWVEISDSGTGIAAENIDRIFEPFFTTRPVGLGTGLGLVAVFNTVTHHHGKIEVHSEQGKGTTFHISLPIRQRGMSVKQD